MVKTRRIHFKNSHPILHVKPLVWMIRLVELCPDITMKTVEKNQKSFLCYRYKHFL